MRNISPIVFCFSKYPCSSIIRLTLDTSNCPSFGTFLSLHFLHLIIFWYLLVSSRKSWIKFFFFPRGDPNGLGLEGQEPHPGENLRLCGPFPVVPVIVKGYWHLMGGRCREGTHRTVPNDKDSLHQNANSTTLLRNRERENQFHDLSFIISGPPLSSTLLQLVSNLPVSHIHSGPQVCLPYFVPKCCSRLFMPVAAEDLPMGRAGEDSPSCLADGSSFLLLLHPSSQVIEFRQFSLTTSSGNVSFWLPQLPLSRHLCALLLSPWPSQSDSALYHPSYALSIQQLFYGTCSICSDNPRKWISPISSPCDS